MATLRSDTQRDQNYLTQRHRTRRSTILTHEGRYTPATTRSYVNVAARFERWHARQHPDNHVLDADNCSINDYLVELERQGISATQRRLTICVLRVFFRCCGSPTADNPAAAIPLPTRPLLRPEAGYEMSELARIMASARTTADMTTGPNRHRAHRDALIVELQCRYPLRPREIAALQISDVGERQLTIGTNERRRTLPLTGAMAAQVHDYLTDHRPHLGDSTQLLPTHNIDPAAHVNRLLHHHGTAVGVPGPHTPTRARRSLIRILVDGGGAVTTVAYTAGIGYQQLANLIAWARYIAAGDDTSKADRPWHAPDLPDADEPPAAA